MMPSFLNSPIIILGPVVKHCLQVCPCAGMTSEGGGAVAFPVMTLALGIKPSVARDFSLMIQSCGECPLSTIAQ